jgi:hypothetical protein
MEGKIAEYVVRKMAVNVVRKMAGNMVPKNGGKMCWHGAEVAPALAGNTVGRKKWRENMEGKMAGNMVPINGGKMSWHGAEAAPALVFFLRWKCGLVKVFMAARRPTLLILRVRDTDRLSFMPSMV